MAKNGNNDTLKWIALLGIGGIAIYFLTRNNNNSNTGNNTNTGNYLPAPSPVYYEPTTGTGPTPGPTTGTGPTPGPTTTTTSKKIYDWVDQIVANVNAGANAQQYADILLNIANENELAQADAVAREVYNMSLAQIFNYISKEILVLLRLRAKGRKPLQSNKIEYPYMYNFINDIVSKK